MKSAIIYGVFLFMEGADREGTILGFFSEKTCLFENFDVILHLEYSV